MSFQLTLEEARFLVKLARRAVGEYLESKKILADPRDVPPKLMKNCGVFVTLNLLNEGKRELRGCIGFPYPTKPLARAVIESAIESATRDPRFYPLSLDELNTVIFEVSVLTPPQVVSVDRSADYPSKIRVGQDGLIVEKGLYRGLLLPQVPVEWEWGEEEFLCQCCMKAGLPPDSWLLKGTKIFKFSSIIAEELAPNGEVVLKDMRKSEN